MAQGRRTKRQAVKAHPRVDHALEPA